MRKAVPQQFSLFEEPQLHSERVISSSTMKTEVSERQMSDEVALHAPIWSSSRPAPRGPIRIHRLARFADIPAPYFPKEGEKATVEQDIDICIYQIRRDLAVIREGDFEDLGREFYQERVNGMQALVKELKEQLCQNSLSP